VWITGEPRSARPHQLRDLLARNSGGQAGSSSLIRNYLGFPHGITGASLATRAFEQAWSFGAITSVVGPVTGLQPASDGYIVSLSDGRNAHARTVVIATGVSYRRLTAPGVDTLVGAGVFYGATTSEASALRGQHVFVAGAANSAGQAAVNLARHAAQVTILVRGDSLAARGWEHHWCPPAVDAFSVSTLTWTSALSGWQALADGQEPSRE
jgi:thioredoxin reductase